MGSCPRAIGGTLEQQRLESFQLEWLHQVVIETSCTRAASRRTVELTGERDEDGAPGLVS
jgi:hypothetical protein